VGTALRLSDERSSVRGSAVSRTRSGTIWVGEYGSFPGARCAWLYRSDDEGKSFRGVVRFPRARHIHAVACLPDSEGVLATTGDVAGERRTYRSVAGGRFFRSVLDAWSGFTAVAFSGGFVHLGTDLAAENGFLRARLGRWRSLEYRPLPGELDLQVRQIEPLGGGRLLALARLDEDLAARDPGRRAALFLSEDFGSTWGCIHRFAAGGGDAPERFALLPGSPCRIATDGTRAAQAMEIPT